MAETYWLTADYFDSFKCKCGSCRHTCCGGWRIAVGEKEYFRIIGLECSEALHAKIEGAFVRPDFPTSDIDPAGHGLTASVERLGLYGTILPIIREFCDELLRSGTMLRNLSKDILLIILQK